jgi:hypothetical protein
MWRLLHDFFTLSENQLDVARVGHVGIDLETFSYSVAQNQLSWAVDNLPCREHGMCVASV